VRDSKKAWIVAVDMGHGHQRAAEPLLPIAYGGEVITANNYDGIPASDKAIWGQSKKFYYFISSLHEKGAPGRLAFRAFDYFQKIDDFYPRKEQIQPPFQLKEIYSLIKGGWGRHLIKKLGENPVPLVTTFFTVAFMAEYWKYPGPLYAVVTDSDVSRAWASLSPKSSRINYFAPTARVVKRLESYGVPQDRIIHTGFTLPLELLGQNLAVAKDNLAKRIANLDPAGVYKERYAPIIRKYLGTRSAVPSPVSLSFVVGGAGAQSGIGMNLISSLKELIKQNKLRLNLLAGIHRGVVQNFNWAIDRAGLRNYLGKSIFVITAGNKADYFKLFNQTLFNTDILWSKPSELSFYAALGMPLVIAPPIGSQEIKNREWLQFNCVAIDQLHPLYAHEWLPDFISSGRLAEAAMEGFIKLEKQGTENIIKHITQRGMNYEV